jgi:excisionase family DNA binding protein
MQLTSSMHRIASIRIDMEHPVPGSERSRAPSSNPSQCEVRITQMASMAARELGPMLTASEVAELLHLHVNTVKRLGDRGELPFYRVCKRGDRRFRLDDVLTFLAGNR